MNSQGRNNPKALLNTLLLSLALLSVAAVLAIMIVRSVAALQQSSSEGWSYRMPESMRSIPPPPPPA